MTNTSRPSPESTTVRLSDDNRSISSKLIRMDFLFSFRIRMDEQTAPPIETPEGLKFDGSITGGEFAGPELIGHVKPAAGAGSLLVKPNGVAVVELRFTMESGDGAVIDGVHHGLIDFGPTGFEEIRNKRMPTEVDGRVTARYQTSHPKYEWLNRTQCVGAIETDFESLCIKQSIFAMF
jgi:hypothetical protein